MAISIDGSNNTIAGLANGGLPDGCILDADINGMAASKLTGALPAISGAALTNISGGKMVNYSQTFKTDTFSADIPQGNYSGDAISMSYAAANSNNKLLIICHLMIGYEATQRVGFGLFIGGSFVSAASGDASGNQTRVAMGDANGGDSRAASTSQTYLHGGSGTTNTNSTTYSCRLWQGDNATKMTYLNRSHWDGNYDYGYRGASSMTILEFEP
tara:strand:- start:362 stop:1006 length:645 start_codon:yes stop_codon:yes gene_type:complete